MEGDAPSGALWLAVERMIRAVLLLAFLGGCVEWIPVVAGGLGVVVGAEREARMIRTLALVFLLIAGPALGQARDTPDDDLTPGVARSDISDTQIRHTAWGKDRRHVTPAMKAEVFRRYHVTGDKDPSCGKPRCEIDHRTPRACGGADDVDNLWMQAAPYWHEKDLLEDYAARQVKAGKLTVEQCQAMFMAPADWRIGFEAIFQRKP